MALFVVSDLHLGESTLASMFRDPEQGLRFADLCAGIARNPENEPVLLGDIFDLTAAHPPHKGPTAVVLQHGHLWDPSCATPTGGGETMTAILHHAVIPFLRHLAPRSNVLINPDRVIALRPEERVVPVLERWLKPGVFERFIDAFLELLVENGALARPLAWVTTPSLLRWRLKDDDDLWERAGASAMAVLEGAKSLPGKPPPPDVLVLGHTHVMDWAVQDGRPGVQRLYVNLGTWSARATDAAGPMDAAMPLLRIEADSRQLRAELFDCARRWRPLQRFEVDR